MDTIVVTAGAKGADIDVLACAIAYAELLKLEGKEAIPVVAGKFTSSVTPTVLGWGAEFQRSYEPAGAERFVMVDISDPDHFPNFVAHDRIAEIYDHRYGHEEFWQEKLGGNAKIEMVGACGTLIWEEYLKRDKTKKISEASARLLLASVVSNTLNFRSPQTTERDSAAFEQLSIKANLPDGWVETYFKEQEDILFENFEDCVVADTKRFKIHEGDFVIGQIELWDAERVVEERIDELHEIMSRYEPIPWIVNIINISKGFNYIFSKSEAGKKSVQEILDVTFNDGIAQTEGLLMRKHLMKKLRDHFTK